MLSCVEHEKKFITSGQVYMFAVLIIAGSNVLHTD